MRNWKRTINIKQYLGPDKPLAEVRDPMAAALKQDPAYKDDYEFEEIVDNLAEAENVAVFDEWLSALYDWADATDVWIGSAK